MEQLPIRLLGQSGCRLQYPACVVYVDPYLSNSVQELDAPDLARMQPIPLRPEEVTDADWVLITHEHIDHCDPHTLPQLATASPRAQFMGPAPVLDQLRTWGIDESRLRLAAESWKPLSEGIEIHTVPAAHPTIERDRDGQLRCAGFVIQFQDTKLYVAGDTSIAQELLAALHALGPIHAAMLPVNEHNFFRGRRGIVGNMSIREAFQLADELDIKHVIPVHWDMFAANDVAEDEIVAVYRHMHPNFQLHVRATGIALEKP